MTDIARGPGNCPGTHPAFTASGSFVIGFGTPPGGLKKSIPQKKNVLPSDAENSKNIVLPEFDLLVLSCYIERANS